MSCDLDRDGERLTMRADTRWDIRIPRVNGRRCEESHGMCVVTPASSKTYRVAVESLARCCAVETDNVVDELFYAGQREYHSEVAYRAHCWRVHLRDTVQREGLIGCACFRNRADIGWALAWVWLHPFARRKGLLQDAWPAFVAEYGDFAVEPPLSQPMVQFMEKVGYRVTAEAV